MTRSYLRLLLLLLPVFWLGMPNTASATVTCSATMGNLTFGSFDPQTGATPVSAKLNWTCRNDNSWAGANVNVCFSIGAGSAGAGQTNPRQIVGGIGNPLKFQLYRDTNYLQIWGSVLTPATPDPVRRTFSIPLAFFGAVQSHSDTETLYGTIAGNQTGVTAGTYTSQFNAAEARISFNYNETFLGTGTPPSSCGDGNNGSFPFTVTANVQRTCTVTAGAASNIDFGNVSSSTTGSISATNNIQVTCLNGTPYIVGLATTDGNNGTGHMVGLDPGNSTDKVAYTLRRTSNTGPIWGNTGTAPGTSTVGNDLPGTGTGLSQTIPVYAVVTDLNHIPGHYRDTVTVNVIY
jgi:spore coat protein U-like protein